MASLKVLDFFRIIYRSLFIQATWNYERMQSLGYCFCMIPFTKKNIKNKARRIQFLKRSLAFFNTHPYMVNWIIGAAIKLEQQSLLDQSIEIKQIDRFKERMSGVVAAIGDNMFWSQIKPISVVIGFMFVLYSPITGLLVFFVLYNLPHLYVRTKGLLIGYQTGFNLVNSVTLKNYNLVIKYLNKVGGLLIGILLGLIAISNHISNNADLVAFLCGIVLMYTFIKLKVPVPMALIILIVMSSLIGAFIIN